MCDKKLAHQPTKQRRLIACLPSVRLKMLSCLSFMYSTPSLSTLADCRAICASSLELKRMMQLLASHLS